MNARKTLLATLALAALTATGLGAASAQPRHHDRFDRDVRAERHVVIERPAYRPAHRATVTRMQVNRMLRNHRFVGIGNPYFLRGQYVVRSQDRFGRVVLVRLDPWTGRFIGTIRL